MTTPLDIPGLRLRGQLLVGTPAAEPLEVIRHLVAVQAQDYLGAAWAVAQRTVGATMEDLNRLLASGAMIRTHPMRPTWHLVLPQDLRWLLALTGPRVHVANGSMYRKEGLDDATMRRADEILARAVEGGRFQTRPELREALVAAGIRTDGFRLTLLVMHAELEAAICSGPMRGKQFTYANFDEWVPPQPPKDREQSLADLALRYVRSHGPATAHDFSWWSGLTVGDCRAGLAANGEALVSIDTDRGAYWTARDVGDPVAPTGRVHLLSNYDEHTVAYRDHEPTLHPTLVGTVTSSDPALALHHIVRDGVVIGGWRRTVKRREVVVETDLLLPISGDERDAITREADRFGSFLGLPARVVERTARD